MNPLVVVRKHSMYREEEPKRIWNVLWVWCPGCDKAHTVYVEGDDGYRPTPCWEWDGEIEDLTVGGSILVHASGDQPTCHSFIKNGQWEFLEDSQHDLAGQTVPMVPVPDWLVK